MAHGILEAGEIVSDAGQDITLTPDSGEVKVTGSVLAGDTGVFKVASNEITIYSGTVIADGTWTLPFIMSEAPFGELVFMYFSSTSWLSITVPILALSSRNNGDKLSFAWRTDWEADVTRVSSNEIRIQTYVYGTSTPSPRISFVQATY